MEIKVNIKNLEVEIEDRELSAALISKIDEILGTDFSHDDAGCLLTKKIKLI